MNDRPLRAFAAVWFTYFAAIGLFSTYAPLWFKSLGLPALVIGLIASLQSWTRVLAPYGWGWLADHSGRRVELMRLAAVLAALSAAALALTGRLGLAGLGQPDQRGEDGRQCPEGQRRLPGMVHQFGQRHRGAGGQRRAQAQGHGVDPGHQAGDMGKVAFDDAGQQHADDADARPRHQAAEEQPRYREQAAQHDAAGLVDAAAGVAEADGRLHVLAVVVARERDGKPDPRRVVVVLAEDAAGRAGLQPGGVDGQRREVALEPERHRVRVRARVQVRGVVHAAARRDPGLDGGEHGPARV